MKQCFAKLLLLLNLFICTSAFAQPLHFAILFTRDSEDAFWGPVEAFAQQAATQLDIKLSVLHSKNSKRIMLQNIRKAKALNVDAVIFPNFSQTALNMLKEAEQLQLPSLLFNSDITVASKQLSGKPQEKLKYWLASLMPDDKQAGYLLGKQLITQARQKKLTDKDDSVKIVAINGTLAETPSVQRFDGLQQAIKEDGNSQLIRSVHANWLKEMARYKVFHLSRRYPEAKVYWAASDIMAIGVNDTLTEKGLVQGKDYLTGGVDWSKEGLTAIKENKISSSAGGHYMEGAWAVIMLYDHFNGCPIDAETADQFHSSMALITNDDLELLLPHLASKNWQDINFRLRSKVLNKRLKEYDFSVASVLKELRNRH